KMSLTQCRSHLILLLLLMIRGSLSVPALDNPPPAATPNTIEELDKLPESGEPSIASSQDAILAGGNDTSTQVTSDTSDKTVPDNVASGSNIDPTTVYAGGILSPELFQQYLNSYSGFGPYAGSYPSPVGAAAPGIYPYPGAIVMQTGYEGFLVPANGAGQTDSTTVVASATESSSSSNPLLSFASNLLPTVLLSTVLRIAAVVLSAVGIILFGGAITSALCRITPICDIPARAVNILRTGGAQDVGRMLAEEMTPERVRRATQFVQNAIKKYQQLQNMMEESSGVADVTK
ncbi:hypothetical protein KR032_008746, partial [Drosophila birchii]